MAAIGQNRMAAGLAMDRGDVLTGSQGPGAMDGGLGGTRDGAGQRPDTEPETDARGQGVLEK